MTDSFNEMEGKGRATAALAAKIPALQDVLSIAGVAAAVLHSAAGKRD